MSNENYGPCARHPDALVRHTYDLTQYVMNGLPEGIQSNHRYECNECGADLAPTKTVVIPDGKMFVDANVGERPNG